MKLPGVSDPLVDQYEARPVFLEKLAQNVAGACRILVVSADALKSPLSAKLPG
jgi:hypothetical protein